MTGGDPLLTRLVVNKMIHLKILMIHSQNAELAISKISIRASAFQGILWRFHLGEAPQYSALVEFLGELMKELH